MTFVEKLTLVSSFAALISAAAALFTSIAQVFIARSSNLYAYRLESDKLFFHAKVEAYQQFFQATDRCVNLPDRTSAGDLLARCSYAILFSEEDATCKKTQRAFSTAYGIPLFSCIYQCCRKTQGRRL